MWHHLSQLTVPHPNVLFSRFSTKLNVAASGFSMLQFSHVAVCRGMSVFHRFAAHISKRKASPRPTYIHADQTVTGNEDTGLSSRKLNVPDARRSMTAGPDLELEGSEGVRSVYLAAWSSNFPLETSLQSCHVLWFWHAAWGAGDTVAAQENTRGRIKL